MRTFFLTVLVIFPVFFLVIPEVGFAQIVPCDGVSDNPSKVCGTCHLVQLGDNILKWVIGIMVSVCAIIIMMAGFKMVTAAGNSGALSEAKSLITNAIVGFVILLAAWLIVDTVLRVLVSGADTSGDAAVIPIWGPWNKIQCVEQPAPVVIPPEEPPPTACTIPSLTPLTDPYALQMEGGIRVVWNNEALRTCVVKFVQRVGGTVASAYRPPQYQTHLWEIHDRWCAKNLQSNTDAACQSLKTTISSEMNGHGLSCSRPVGVTSNHSNGTAVDINGISHGSSAVLDAAQASCLSWYGSADPVHYTLKSGCTCN